MRYYKLTRIEICVVIAILIAISIDGRFLYLSLTQSTREISETLRVGHIQYVDGDVRIRPSESTLWDTARPNDFIANLDKVFNGQKSFSKVALVNGAVVELGGNTLVQFFKHLSVFGVDISSGKIEIDNTEAVGDIMLRLSGEKQNYKLDHRGRIVINLAKATGRDVQCRTFEISFEDPDTNAVKQQKIDCLGNVEEFQSHLFFPISPNSEFVTYDTQTIEFRWQQLIQRVVENAQVAVYQVINDTLEPVFRKPYTKAQVVEYSGLKPGSYEWRIENTEGEALSDSEQFKVRNIPFPPVFYPRTSLVLFSTTNSVSFRWQRAADLFRVRFQLALDPDFNNILIDKLTTLSEEVISGPLFEELITRDTFYWRVIPEIERVSQTEMKKRRIPYEETHVTQAKELIFPQDGEIIQPEEEDENTIMFEWPVADQKKFHFELRDHLNEPIEQHTTKLGMVTIERLPPGIYKWEVRSEKDKKPLITSQFWIPGGVDFNEDNIQLETAQNKVLPLEWDITFVFNKPYLIAGKYETKLFEAEADQEITKFRQLSAAEGYRALYRGLDAKLYKLKIFPQNADISVLEYDVDLRGKSPIKPPNNIQISQSKPPKESRALASEGGRILHLSWDRAEYAQSYEILLFPGLEEARTNAEPLDTLLTNSTFVNIPLEASWIGKSIVLHTHAIDPKGRKSKPQETNIRVK